MQQIGLAEKIYNWLEVAKYMMYVSQRHPRMDKVWNRWSDKPLEGTFERYIYAAKFFPSVWLKPIE